MLDRRQLRELHGASLPLHILEQDYLQAMFLTELYRVTDSLVFKGGTYLRHVHGLDRYSEDLDFSATGTDVTVDPLLATTDRLERYGINAELSDIDERSDAILASLRYEGPMFDGSNRSRGTIELDVSLLDDILEEPIWHRLFVPYPETRTVTARCLTITEAFAEKIRALGTRTRGRDLYDCWYLLNQDVDIDAAMVANKFEAIEAEPEVHFTIEAAAFYRDLSILLEHPPSYDEVAPVVIAALEAADLTVVDRRR